MAVFQKGLFQGDGEFQVDWDKGLADDALGDDALALLALLPGYDPGVGSDGLQLELPFGDPAVGAESLSLVANLILNDSATGLETLDPSGSVPVPGFDSATGADQLGLEARITLADAAVGADELIRAIASATKPRLTGGGRGKRYIETDTFGAEDKAAGGEDFTLEAFLAAVESAEGTEGMTIDKQYPQLAAFHMLMAL